ncbi:molybdopterin-binding oxidoreductase, partial [Streptomyces sp. NPDC048551]
MVPADSTQRARSGGRRAAGALSGLVAAFAGLAAAELAAVAVRPEAAPLTAIGAGVVDRTPVAVKEWAIRTFGTSDKLALTLGITLVLALLAAGTGLLAVRRPGAGAALAGAVGVVGAVAALGRPEASWKDALPSLAGGAVAATTLYLLVSALRRPGRSGGTWPMDRRGFGRLVAATVAGSALAALAGRRLGAHGSARATASRAGLALPAPAVPARPVPAGADLRLP